MPSFEDVSIDFEVFCGGCGAGICGNADTRKSRNRGMPQVTVDPCKKCLEVATEEGYLKAQRENDNG